MSEENDKNILRNRIVWGLQDALRSVSEEIAVSAPRGNWLLCRSREMRGVAGDIDEFATRYAGATAPHVVDQIIDLEGQVEALKRENAEWKRRHLAQEEQSVIDASNIRYMETEWEKQKHAIRQLLGWWRAASNVMSEAEGDGPVRSSLRKCAKDLEDVLSGKSQPASSAQ